MRTPLIEGRKTEDVGRRPQAARDVYVYSTASLPPGRAVSAQTPFPWGARGPFELADIIIYRTQILQAAQGFLVAALEIVSTHSRPASGR